jgi:hypothetical protein
MDIQNEIALLQKGKNKSTKDAHFEPNERFKGVVKKTIKVDTKDKIINHFRDELRTREEIQNQSGPFANTHSPRFFEEKFNTYQIDNQSKQNYHNVMLFEVINISITVYSYKKNKR